MIDLLMRMLRTIAYHQRAVFRPESVAWTSLDQMKAEIDYWMWTEWA